MSITVEVRGGNLEKGFYESTKEKSTKSGIVKDINGQINNIFLNRQKLNVKKPKNDLK